MTYLFASTTKHYRLCVWVLCLQTSLPLMEFSRLHLMDPFSARLLHSLWYVCVDYPTFYPYCIGLHTDTQNHERELVETGESGGRKAKRADDR